MAERLALCSSLPPAVARALRDSLSEFDRRMRGYLTHEAIIIGAETTTSSPIRVLRDEGFESVSVKGLFPTGEGAGYAGGIISAAVDGLRSAKAIVGRWAPLTT